LKKFDYDYCINCGSEIASARKEALALAEEGTE